MAKYNKQILGNSAAAKKNSSKSKVIAVITIFLLIVVAIIVWNILRPKTEKNNFIVTEDNADSIREDLTNKVNAGMFEVRMNTEWTFKNSDSSSDNAYIANAEANNYPIYFEIIVDDSEETILTSPLIPVGSKIENITLEKKLNAGTYPVTVIYHLVDDNGEEVSNVSVAASVIILN